MTIKYQVFVSSTYEDLRAERDQVIKAVLEMGHIPVGMEMFSAADEEQWRLIARTIDQSDYYVVIVAHRYGSTVDGVSYTEKEYDYAAKQGVPVIGFVIDDKASWPTQRIEADGTKRAALEVFKAKVKKKPVGFWSSAEDLHGKFSIALMKLFITNPRPGWARANELAGPTVMAELSRLSSENAKLREQLAEAHIQHEEDERIAVDRAVNALRGNNRVLKVRRRNESKWQEIKSVALLDIFAVLAPEFMIEKSVEDASRTLAVVMSGISSSGLSESFPIASNVLKAWFADLLALNLIKPSDRRHAVRDVNEYWTLTDFGRDVYTNMRRAVLEAGNTSTSEGEESGDSE